jgi:thiosulfate dehydrogenase [quinone] large subunit
LYSIFCKEVALSAQTKNKVVGFDDPPVAKALFSDPRWSWLWLIARVYVGYTWLSAGLEKLSSPAWTQTGTALQGFWKSAVAIPETGRPAITFGWYRAFLESMLNAGAYTWFSKVIVAGELLIGIAMILGLFTGIAAFFGGFMNWNFMMAGSASVNPVLFTLSVLLILAWKTAGWLGLDHFVLPVVGTPWQPGKIFPNKAAESGQS